MALRSPNRPPVGPVLSFCATSGASETSATADAAISVRNLRFAYGARAVIDLDSFELQARQSCAVIGPSGCGKSTFVSLLAGLLLPKQGEIHVFGQDLQQLSESQRDRFRGKHIGFVFQQFHLLPALSVRENLRLAQRLARCDANGAVIDELLHRLGIAGLARRRPRELSQGQSQRVALARALVHSPQLVIADEPTSSLDDASASASLALLRELTTARRAALIVVTHDHRVRGELDREFQLGNIP